MMRGNSGEVSVRVYKVEGKFSLGKEIVPVIDREGWVCGCEDAEKMPFEGSNTTFCGVGTLLVGWDEVVDNALRREEVGKGGRSLIV
jgi:hypothetical protein